VEWFIELGHSVKRVELYRRSGHVNLGKQQVFTDKNFSGLLKGVMA